MLHQRSVTFDAYQAIPDDIKVGVPFASRLATITAKADGIVDDQTRVIDVTIDAMGGRALAPHRRFFPIRAERANVVGGLYFITTEAGCCGLPARHHVRDVETGA